MPTSAKSNPAKVPRAAAAKNFSPLAARRLGAELQNAIEEIARLTPMIYAKDAECAGLKQSLEKNENDVAQRRAHEDETLAPAHTAALKELEDLYVQLEKLQATRTEADAKMPTIAEETLRALYPAAVQTGSELARLGEIEARLQGEKLVIERDCDPEDEPKLKELESITTRLLVIPGKRARWEEKLAAQELELKPHFEAGQIAFSRAVRGRRELVRARFEATINPFFEDGKVPPVVENDLVSLLRETTASGQLDRIENAARGSASGYQFELSLVPPLLAGFEALAALEEAS